MYEDMGKKISFLLHESEVAHALRSGRRCAARHARRPARCVCDMNALARPGWAWWAQASVCAHTHTHTPGRSRALADTILPPLQRTNFFVENSVKISQICPRTNLKKTYKLLHSYPLQKIILIRLLQFLIFFHVLIYIRLCVYVCVNVCVCVCVNIFTHTHTRVCVCVCVYVYF